MGLGERLRIELKVSLGSDAGCPRCEAATGEGATSLEVYGNDGHKATDVSIIA
jgi:hypothetical protein